jgi:hypothetical protein
MTHDQRMNHRPDAAVCIGSPHDALELTAQPTVLPNVFMCQQG